MARRYGPSVWATTAPAAGPRAKLFMPEAALANLQAHAERTCQNHERPWSFLLGLKWGEADPTFPLPERLPDVPEHQFGPARYSRQQAMAAVWNVQGPPGRAPSALGDPNLNWERPHAFINVP